MIERWMRCTTFPTCSSTRSGRTGASWRLSKTCRGTTSPTDRSRNPGCPSARRKRPAEVDDPAWRGGGGPVRSGFFRGEPAGSSGPTSSCANWRPDLQRGIWIQAARQGRRRPNAADPDGPPWGPAPAEVGLMLNYRPLDRRPGLPDVQGGEARRALSPVLLVVDLHAFQEGVPAQQRALDADRVLLDPLKRKQVAE